MKKVLSILLTASAIAFAGCSEGENNEDAEGDATEETSNEEANITIEWNVPEGAILAVADIDIMGMACQMNCVNKVNTSITGLEGVKDCSIDFDPDAEIDRATVTFDPNKVSENQLIEAVTGIADGAYSILTINVVEAKSDANSSDSSDDGESASLNDNTSSSLTLPNIIEVFYSLF